MKFGIDPATATVIKRYPHRAEDLVKSFSDRQVICKHWLAEELDKIIKRGIKKDRPKKRIYVAGCWYGNVLVPLITDMFPDCDIRMHDINEQVIKIVKNIYFPDLEQLKASVLDSQHFSYSDTLINTSCEHMKPLKCTSGTLMILQSNDYTHDKDGTAINDHINCVKDVDELIAQYKMREDKIFYKGEKDFVTYKRFMAIGLRK